MQFQVGPERIEVNVTGRDALLAAVASRFRAGRGFAIATLNLDHLVKLARDPVFRAAYAAQDFVTADGNPIVWMSRLGARPVELVTGSDLILPLVREAAAAGMPVALFGATEESLDAAAQSLSESVPGVEIVCRIAPPMGFDPEGQAARHALDQLADAGARLVLVALGAPKQERFAAFGRSVRPELGFASIGAGLDFLSGAQRRAPKWARAIAAEWLWRLLSDPGRLAGRYGRSAAILPGHVWRSWRGRAGR